METILIGKIVNAVGIRGEVKIYNYSEPGRFGSLESVLLREKSGFKEYRVVKARTDGNCEIVKLAEINDRNAAERMKNLEVYIYDTALEELPEDTFYIRDLIGCKVNDAHYGLLGVVEDVIQNTAQDIYVVKTKNSKEIMIPAVKDFINKIMLEEKVIYTTLIPGFIDESIEVNDEN